MINIPDPPYITGAERYGTAYRDAYVWGGRVEDYDVPDFDEDEELEELE